MGEHPNAAVVRAALEAMSRGDMQASMEMAAEDVVWHYLGSPEPIRGRAAMAAMAGSTDFTIEAKIHDIVASDDHVVALVLATATRGDRTLEYRTAEIFHLRDGRVTERWAFSDDTAAIVDFFA